MPDPFDRDSHVRYGVAEEMAPEGAPRIRRVTARNPSPMTFTGTRSYLVGEREVALIDPGPGEGDHHAALRAALGRGERIAHILVTHTHVDHSALAPAVAAATGAPVAAFGPHGAGMSATMRRLSDEGVDLGGGEGADRDLAPERALADGDSVAAGDWNLTALHTPGHLSNHLSFALGTAEGEATGILFTGDTLMGWATTLVSPPEGDMAAFMATLRRLAAGDESLYLPGHGHPVTDPARMVAWQIAHREERREQVLAGLDKGPADAAALAEAIYPDLDPALMRAARRNVLATLLWLMEEGRVRPRGPLSAEAAFELA